MRALIGVTTLEKPRKYKNQRKSIGVSTLYHFPSNFFLVVVGLANKFFERLKSSFNGLSLASQTDDY